MKSLPAATVLCFAALGLAAQSVPTAINFQSRVFTNDTIPVPVTGTRTMSFSIWSASTGGTQLWVENELAIDVNGGNFSVLLGSTTPIPATIFTGSSSRYIQVVLDGETMSPRQRLVTAPFAFKCEQAAAGAAGFTSNGSNGQSATLAGVLASIPFPGSPPGPYYPGVIGLGNVSNGIGLYGEGMVGVAGKAYAGTGAPGVTGIGDTGISAESDVTDGYGAVAMAYGANGVGLTARCGGACTGSGRAGVFEGNVWMSSNLDVSNDLTANHAVIAGWLNAGSIAAGYITAGTKNFRIDHPLDPLDRVLVHTSVESDEMLTLYSGTVVTDARGAAEVRFPDWFGALNEDFRYQLTVIGVFAQAIVEREIANGSFGIRTDKPGVKVSWQVTARRHDPFALAHPTPAEQDKTPGERGRCLYPEACVPFHR